MLLLSPRMEWLETSAPIKATWLTVQLRAAMSARSSASSNASRTRKAPVEWHNRCTLTSQSGRWNFEKRWMTPVTSCSATARASLRSSR